MTVIDEGVFARWLSLNPSSFASVNKQVDYKPSCEFASLPISTMPRSFKVRYIPCPVKSCTRQFTNQGGLKNHIRMHRTPQANQDQPAYQAPMNDDNIPVDIEQDAQEPHPEHQNHPPNPEKVAKEKITYHPLINGTLSPFYSQKI